MSGGIHIYLIFFIHNDILCYKHSKYPGSNWTWAVDFMVKETVIKTFTPLFPSTNFFGPNTHP
jgi:hypothetical protein